MEWFKSREPAHLKEGQLGCIQDLTFFLRSCRAAVQKVVEKCLTLGTKNEPESASVKSIMLLTWIALITICHQSTTPAEALKFTTITKAMKNDWLTYEHQIRL
jgi:hypothetical protein